MCPQCLPRAASCERSRFPHLCLRPSCIRRSAVFRQKWYKTRSDAEDDYGSHIVSISLPSRLLFYSTRRMSQPSGPTALHVAAQIGRHSKACQSDCTLVQLEVLDPNHGRRKHSSRLRAFINENLSVYETISSLDTSCTLFPISIYAPHVIQGL